MRHWPWGAVPHVCDFKVSLLEQNLIFNTSRVELLESAWLGQEFVNFFNWEIDDSNTFRCNISLDLDFEHFTRLIRILLPGFIGLKFFEFDNDFVSNLLKFLNSWLGLVFHVCYKKRILRFVNDVSRIYSCYIGVDY